MELELDQVTKHSLAAQGGLAAREGCRHHDGLRKSLRPLPHGYSLAAS